MRNESLRSLASAAPSCDTKFEAARLADVTLERGNNEERLLWLRIRRPIEALSTRPRASRTEARLPSLSFVEIWNSLGLAGQTHQGNSTRDHHTT
jgi:hypothetical protein